MKELGLAKGDTDAAVAAGAHAMFLPHGLGHMMGLDVHDMEALGQIYVGFDEETRPNLEQFGTNCLRMDAFQEGFGCNRMSLVSISFLHLLMNACKETLRRVP